MCNQALRDNNISGQIDHRSYESQGMNQLGSVHLGPFAYQQIMLSATLASEQDQSQTQFAVAAAMAKGTEQLLNVLNTLEQTLAVKQKELSALSPIQAKKRKDLESEIIDTEKQIPSVKKRLSDLQAAYNKPTAALHTPDSESVEQRRERIHNLKAIQSQTYKEFYSLVEENRENIAELRALIQGKRNTKSHRH